jgi:four helix bundle protein
MFDFEKLLVYQKAKELNRDIKRFTKSQHLDRTTKDQLLRASLSILLNISEGSGRYTKADKRSFYIRSRGSVYECVSVFNILHDDQEINSDEYRYFYSKYEELSKMLLGLINSQK